MQSTSKPRHAKNRSFIFLLAGILLFISIAVDVSTIHAQVNFLGNQPKETSVTTTVPANPSPYLPSREGIQPLAVDGSSFYYYVNKSRISLSPSLEWVSVKFASKDPDKRLTTLQEHSTQIEGFHQIRQIPKPEISLLRLQDGLTPRELIVSVNSLRADSTFLQVNPVFEVENTQMLITDEFIATFPLGMSINDISTLNLSHGIEIVEPVLGQGNTFVLRVKPAKNVDALAMANLYQESGIAIHAAPNFIRMRQANPVHSQINKTGFGPMSEPSDSYYLDQWSLDNRQPYGTWMTPDADIDAPEAWDHTTGSSSVIIAIIDEGVDLTHEDLNTKLVTGYDATGLGSGGGPSGNDAHGTSVAGIAAAISNNNIGIAGVCQDCRLMPVRIAYDLYGYWITQDSWIANGITWAYQHGASILNNSWGGGSASTVINTAISNAKNFGRNGKGSILVFAAGNDNKPDVSYPAYLSNVIAVGASNMCDQRKTPTNNGCNGYETTWGSNYGSALDISAPGVWLDSSDIMGSAGYTSGNYFQFMNGTSGATPIVSGVAGLILSVNPNLTADQVQSILQNTADDVNGGGWDINMGYGRVNANRSVQEAKFYNWSGSVTVSSNQPIVSIGRPHIGSEVLTYNGFSGGNLIAYVPMLFKDAFGGSYDSALYVQNLNTSNTANITIYFYDSSGNQTYSMPDTIPPLASKGYWLPSISALGSSWVGGVVVESNRNIVAVGRPHVGSQVMTYNGFSTGSLNAYVPMLFKNAFGGAYDSALYIQNVDPSNTANITLKFYDSSGAQTHSMTDTLSPLASKGYWLPGIAGLGVSWIGGVKVESDRNVVAVGRPHVGSQVITYNGVTDGSTNAYIPMLFKDAFGGSYDSAFYIQNVDPSNDAHITIRFYDNNGAETHSMTDTVSPLASKGYWLPSIPALGPSWVGGVKVESDWNIVAMGRPHIGSQVMAYNGFTSGSINAHVPMLFKNAFGGSYDSALYLQNMDPSNTADVTIRFYDADGNLNCTLNDNISALASKGWWLPGLSCVP